MSTPRNPANDRHQATFRLPSDLLDRLDQEAARRVIGRSFLVEHLIRVALPTLPDLPEPGGAE